MLRFVLAVSLLFASAQPAHGPDQLPAIPMPPDRAADSYRLYSALMPLGETASPGWPHALFLVQDTTVAIVAPDKPCYVRADPARGFDFGMNPHSAFDVPERYRQDFAEILEDFDRRCHERLTLDPTPGVWKVDAPVHLLNPAEQEEFRMTRGVKDSAAVARFKGAPGLYAFSEVYFNAHHTVAIVYATHWCGGLCGQGFWVAFTMENDARWHSHAWSNSGWIS